MLNPESCCSHSALQPANSRGSAVVAPNRRTMLRITAVAGITLVLGGETLTELLRRASLHRVSVTRTQLGTAVTVTVVHPDALEAREMVDAASTEIERLEQIFSRYRAASALTRLNREAALFDAPPELSLVMGRALEYARLSEGAFDPTIAPVLDLYVGR